MPELKTYHRINSNPPEEKKINKKNILFRLFGIFSASASPYFGIAPFGLSFMTLERSLSLKTFISAVFVFLGTFLLGDKLITAKYTLTTFLYMLSLFVLERGVVLSPKVSALIMSLSLGAVTTGIGYIRGFNLDTLLTLIYEVCGILIGAFAMECGKKILLERRLFSRNLSGEEKLSLIILGIIFFLSIKNFNYIKNLYLSNIVAAFLILGAGRSCGPTIASVLGIVLGGLCGIETDYFLPMIGAFGFCALGTGIASKKGKIWSILALTISNAIVVVYVNGAIREMLSVYEILIASILFSLVPDNVYDRFGRLLKIKNNEAALIRRVKGSLILRLKSVSLSFSALSETLSRLSDKDGGENLNDVATIFDRTADKVCKKCKKADFCWGRKFNSTYKKFFSLLDIINTEGALSETDVNEVFSTQCNNIPKLTNEINHQFNMFRLNRSWRKRMGESREAVSVQISGISKIINELAREINEDVNYDSLAASEMRLKTESRGIRIKDIAVLKNREGNTKIEMSIRQSDWTNRSRGVIRSVAENILGKNVNIYKVREDSEFVMIMIDESEQYEIEQGYASIGATEKNGDNFRLVMPGGGKFVITLSDGMGTGKRAANESQAIIELLDSFLRAGFDKHVAVRLINSIMVLKSANETFATLDMCIIDLHSGEVEFIKTGAEPSFIKQGNQVETVRASSLPVGLLPQMEVETFARRVNDGDTIVMITDGIETKDGGNKWIKGFIENTDETSANDLAAKLLDRAIKENNGAVVDDMTVISLKIRKKSA